MTFEGQRFFTLAPDNIRDATGGKSTHIAY